MNPQDDSDGAYLSVTTSGHYTPPTLADTDSLNDTNTLHDLSQGDLDNACANNVTRRLHALSASLESAQTMFSSMQQEIHGVARMVEQMKVTQPTDYASMTGKRAASGVEPDSSGSKGISAPEGALPDLKQSMQRMQSSATWRKYHLPRSGLRDNNGKAIVLKKVWSELEKPNFRNLIYGTVIEILTSKSNTSRQSTKNLNHLLEILTYETSLLQLRPTYEAPITNPHRDTWSSMEGYAKASLEHWQRLSIALADLRGRGVTPKQLVEQSSENRFDDAFGSDSKFKDGQAIVDCLSLMEELDISMTRLGGLLQDRKADYGVATKKMNGGDSWINNWTGS